MAAPSSTTVTIATQLDGLFKEIYADKLINLIPDNAKLVKMIPFSERDSEGNHFNQPVILSQEHGITAASAGDGAFALNSPIAMTTKNAQINGYQLLLRAAMDYETAFKASSSKKAFVKATELIVENMLESITKYLEISLLYGQVGLAKVDDSYDLSDDDTLELQVSSASWAPGIWAGAENALINVYNGSSLFGTAGSGTSNGTADMKITKIDLDNRRITITGDATILGNINTAAQTSGSGLDLFWKGFKGKEMAGIDKIFTNTGTIFGINSEAYAAWKSNIYPVNGSITGSILLKSISNSIARGLDSNAICLIGVDGWTALNSELSGLRNFDFSYKKGKGENGVEAITYYSQNGEIETIAHPDVKRGEAFIFPKERMKRVGATDITFNNPMINGRYFRELNDNAGFELRCYCHQALFLETPAKCTKLTGIVIS
jgi:hypothetical protein